MSQGWEIKSVKRSDVNGRFYVRGINHETADPLFREFGWHVDSLAADARFWLAPEADVSLEALDLMTRYGAPGSREQCEAYIAARDEETAAFVARLRGA